MELGSARVHRRGRRAWPGGSRRWAGWAAAYPDKLRGRPPVTCRPDCLRLLRDAPQGRRRRVAAVLVSGRVAAVPQPEFGIHWSPTEVAHVHGVPTALVRGRDELDQREHRAQGAAVVVPGRRSRSGVTTVSSRSSAWKTVSTRKHSFGPAKNWTTKGLARWALLRVLRKTCPVTSIELQLLVVQLPTVGSLISLAATGPPAAAAEKPPRRGSACSIVPSLRRWKLNRLRDRVAVCEDGKWSQLLGHHSQSQTHRIGSEPGRGRLI